MSALGTFSLADLSGLSQKTQPLAATFTRLSSPAFLPRSHHTLTIVGGKGYIWGGYDVDGNMAGTDMHIVQLPVKSKGKGAGDGEVEYKVVPALGEGQEVEQEDEKLQIQGGGEIPAARADHAAFAIGEVIYVFGGTDRDMHVLEEKGRVWVFNTSSLHWSFLDSESGTSYPSARYQHGAAASEHPLPPDNPYSPASTYKESITHTLAKVPALIGKTITETKPHGTLIICSGLASLDSTSALTDIWTFDVASRTWTSLPSFPSTADISASPSVALTHNRLYAIASSSSDVGSELLYLPLPKSSFYSHAASAAAADPNSSSNLQPMFSGAEKSASEKKGEWTILPFPTNPLAPGPRHRKGAGLFPITTGNGREYLLYSFGQRLHTLTNKLTSPTSSSQPPPSTDTVQEEYDPIFWSDVWSYQTPAVAATASGIKDATRSSLGIATGEGTWAEVKVVADVEETHGGEETEGKSHPGPRGWFAGAGLDGDGFVMWGGKNGKAETEGDGWVVRVKTDS